MFIAYGTLFQIRSLHNYVCYARCEIANRSTCNIIYFFVVKICNINVTVPLSGGTIHNVIETGSINISKVTAVTQQSVIIALASSHTVALIKK